MSNKEQIKECEAFITRNEFEYESRLMDNRQPVRSDIYRVLYEFSNSAATVDFNVTDPQTNIYNYLLQVVG